MSSKVCGVNANEPCACFRGRASAGVVMVAFANWNWPDHPTGIVWRAAAGVPAPLSYCRAPVAAPFLSALNAASAGGDPNHALRRVLQGFDRNVGHRNGSHQVLRIPRVVAAYPQSPASCGLQSIAGSRLQSVRQDLQFRAVSADRRDIGQLGDRLLQRNRARESSFGWNSSPYRSSRP